MNVKTPHINGISEKESKILREWLPKKYYETLGSQLGYHPNHINAVANGRKSNPVIIKHLIDMALKNKVELEKTRENLENLKQ